MARLCILSEFIKHCIYNIEFIIMFVFIIALFDEGSFLTKHEEPSTYIHSFARGKCQFFCDYIDTFVDG